MNNKKLIRKYIKNLKVALPCPRRRKKKYIKDISESIGNILSTNPEITYEQLICDFGSPEEIANFYLNEAPSSLTQGYKRIRHLRIGLIIVVFACAFISFYSIKLADHQNKTAYSNTIYYKEELTLGNDQHDAQNINYIPDSDSQEYLDFNSNNIKDSNQPEYAVTKTLYCYNDKNALLWKVSLTCNIVNNLLDEPKTKICIKDNNYSITDTQLNGDGHQFSQNLIVRKNGKASTKTISLKLDPDNKIK